MSLSITVVMQNDKLSSVCYGFTQYHQVLDGDKVTHYIPFNLTALVWIMSVVNAGSAHRPVYWDFVEP